MIASERGREEHREEAAVRSVHSDRTQQQQQQRDNGPQRVLTGTLSPTNPQVLNIRQLQDAAPLVPAKLLFTRGQLTYQT